ESISALRSALCQPVDRTIVSAISTKICGRFFKLSPLHTSYQAKCAPHDRASRTKFVRPGILRFFRVRIGVGFAAVRIGVAAGVPVPVAAGVAVAAGVGVAIAIAIAIGVGVAVAIGIAVAV